MRLHGLYQRAHGLTPPVPGFPYFFLVSLPHHSKRQLKTSTWQNQLEEVRHEVVAAAAGVEAEGLEEVPEEVSEEVDEVAVVEHLLPAEGPPESHCP